MVAKNKKQPPIIPELDAFLSEGIAAEEEVAMLSSRLAVIAQKQLKYPQRKGTSLVRNTKVVQNVLPVKF